MRDPYTSSLTFTDKALPCFLYGHDIEWNHPRCSEPLCRHCGEMLSYEEVGWQGVFAYCWQSVFYFRSWLRCGWCGKWWGQHQVDCDELSIPF